MCKINYFYIHIAYNCLIISVFPMYLLVCLHIFIQKLKSVIKFNRKSSDHFTIFLPALCCRIYKHNGIIGNYFKEWKKNNLRAKTLI